MEGARRAVAAANGEDALKPYNLSHALAGTTTSEFMCFAIHVFAKVAAHKLQILLQRTSHIQPFACAGRCDASGRVPELT